MCNISPELGEKERSFLTVRTGSGHLQPLLHRVQTFSLLSSNIDQPGPDDSGRRIRKRGRPGSKGADADQKQLGTEISRFPENMQHLLALFVQEACLELPLVGGGDITLHTWDRK